LCLWGADLPHRHSLANMVLFLLIEGFASVGDHYSLLVVAHSHPDSSEADIEELQGAASADCHQQLHFH